MASSTRCCLAIVIVAVVWPCATMARATADELDRKLGPGMKHVSCQVRVTGHYMKRHCVRHFNTGLRCDLQADERRKVRRVAKMCCDDAPSCEPAMLFDEFCCKPGDDCSAQSDCQPWDNAVEEIELANLIFASDETFDMIQDRILDKLDDGVVPSYWPEALEIYKANPDMIDKNEVLIRKYFRSHRLQVAHIAKSLKIIDEHHALNL
ncbi:unnamed protein product [Caenorhabditis bovis]|uniref:Domain of unknown function DB domain-containing protein n=1 Tax=Caenorhabditis bovis TaxID=2654633 RepID=A0A8S1EA09_9PELO|nr:unnamed protein product [Caenorhabditis bovis]